MPKEQAPPSSRRNKAVTPNMRNFNKSIRVGGVWIRSIGGNVELLVELEDGWHLCAKESLDSAFGHIVEPSGILNSPVDYLAVRP
jgi:hypothetical protein